MGVISEELPQYLQIKTLGQPSRPDWVSIYGSFWAALKSFYKKLIKGQREFSLKLKLMGASLERQKQLIQDLWQVKAELSTVKKSLEEQRLKINQFQKALSEQKEES